MYRTAGGRDTGRPLVPALVRDLTDDDLLAIQIQANALRPETTPMEFARQIKRIIDSRPGVTMAEVCHRIVHKSPVWVGKTLGLLHLKKEYQPAVDRGEMPLGSAYELARIPNRFQAQFYDRPARCRTVEFRAAAQAFLKQYQEAVRQGKLDALYSRGLQATAVHAAHSRRSWTSTQAHPFSPDSGCERARRRWTVAGGPGLGHALGSGSIEHQRQLALKRTSRKEDPDKQP